MRPNKDDTTETKNSLLFECQCHRNHYLELSNWNDDEEFKEWLKNPNFKFDEQQGDVSLVFVDQPTTFWQMLRTWWKHKNWYTNDIILNPTDVKNLIEKLKEYDDKYERRKLQAKRARKPKRHPKLIPETSDDWNSY